MSAEKKTSAGAPAWIWRARSLEAPKEKTTRSPVFVLEGLPQLLERFGQAGRAEDENLGLLICRAEYDGSGRRGDCKQGLIFHFASFVSPG